MHRAAPIALLLTTVVCVTSGHGGSASHGLDDCEFEASIRGATEVDLCGFAISSGREAVGWSLQLVTPGGDNSLLFVTEGAGRPVEPEYEIVSYAGGPPIANKYTVLVALDRNVLGATGFHSTTGTLSISRSSPDQVTGTFEFRAVAFSGGSAISVRGAFTSRNQDL